MPLGVLLVAAACSLPVLFWLLRAVARTFLCVFLIVYPTPSLLVVVLMAAVLMFFR